MSHPITSRWLLASSMPTPPPPDVGGWSQLTLWDGGNAPPSHGSQWDSSAAVKITPLIQVFQCGSRDMKVPRCEHHEPKPRLTVQPVPLKVSPSPGLGSELPGSWRSSTALPWPQRSLDSPGACRSSWNEVAPQNCGRSYRCDCRQCWEAEKSEAQWHLNRSIYQTCK